MPFLVTPMDVVKIRLQQQKHPFVKGTCFLYSNGLMDHLCTACADANSNQPCEWFARPGNFTGTTDAFLKITRTEGIRSLWSGLSPTLVMAVPATVLYFSVYDTLLLWLRSRYEFECWWIPMMAGSGARTVATTVVSPLEMIRTKMQSERLTYCAYITAYLTAIYWTGYEYLKREWLRRWNKKETSFTISFICGAVSGSLAAFLTTPFDVAKTHRQITLGQVTHKSYSSTDCKTCATAEQKPVIRGSGATKARIGAVTTYGVMKELVQLNGLRALFAGVVPRIVKISPACAIMIGSYEYTKVLFARRNQRKTV
ncbi:unnamed protein product [Toxocara canis]|uniref:Solute carrier family 25 member 40 n=1 Tax=Toxocara canis TaxID=6265 RepID=A0A183UGG4_TOXCA|nr:unnamed protein product [Toxocara canis]